MKMRIVSIAVGVIAAVSACNSEENVDSSESLGEASLELSTVPSGALCLKVTAVGSSTVNVSVPLTSGASTSSVTIGRLPLGTSTINAQAYDAACSAIANATPTWIADTQTATFRSGVITKLTLNLRANNPVTSNVNFVGNIKSLTTGYDATGLVMSDGTTRMAGNWWPLTGSSTFANGNPSLTGILELVAPRTYNAHGCARTSSQLLCWGVNTAGELGAGVAIGDYSSTPVAVAGTGSVDQMTKLAVGDHHTCWIMSGAVQCLGLNSSGQLGNGTTTNTSTPTMVSGLPASTDLLAASAEFTCANCYAGLYCWGKNSSGQLGLGTTTDQVTATGPILMGTVSLATGSTHACAVRADGTARCWGGNGYGQLGNGTTTQSLTPTQVSGVTDAVQVVAGGEHTCFRHKDGRVSCVGGGRMGQLGDGTAQNRPLPTEVPGVVGAIALSSGLFHTCALQEDQVVKCWGWDLSAQSGDGVEGDNYTPIAGIVQ